jgi:hypothetical protein
MFPGNGSNNGYSSASSPIHFLTDSRTELTELTVSLITSHRGPCRKQLFHSCSPALSLRLFVPNGPQAYRQVTDQCQVLVGIIVDVM